MRYLEGKEREQFSCSPALSDFFVEWFVGITIDNFGTIDWDTLWSLLIDNYNLQSAEKEIYEYVITNFRNNDSISLNENQTKIYNRVKNFLFALHSNDMELARLDLSRDNNSMLISVCSSKIISQRTQYKEIDLQLLYFDYLRNKETILQKLAEALKDSDGDKELKDLFILEGIEQLYSFYNISTVEDLKRAQLANVSDAFFFVIDQLIQNIELNSDNIVSIIEEKVDCLINKLAEENRPAIDLFFESQGIGNKLVKPFQKELNKKYGMDPFTIDRKKKEVLKRADELEPQLTQLICMVLSTKYGNRKYYEYELLSYLFNSETIDFICLLTEYSNSMIMSFDRKRYVFYCPSVVKLENLISSLSESMSDLIHFDEYSQFSLLKKNLVSEGWRRKTKYYLRKELTELRLALGVITEFFVRGYHIQNDYKKLCGCLKEKYGEDFECPSISVVIWQLQNDIHFCQVDRGTYLPWNKCPDFNLIEQGELINFIQDSGEIVYYRTIYEHFKDEFKSKGVNNHYFVKGIVDHLIEGYGYSTNRDFIKKEGTEITGKQAILQKILEFDGMFTIQQLRNLFPGVQDYTFQNIMLETDEILSLGGMKYVALANCGVTEKGEEMIISEALNILNATNGRPLIVKKILSKIKLFYDGYKDELGYITTPTALYHFLSKSEKANELFEFKNPYIALKGVNKEEMNFKTSLRKALSEQDEITLESFRKAISNIGVTKNYPVNFVDIIEEMSDEYLLVERYRLVKTKNLLINKSEIDKVKTRVVQIISKKGLFDSDIQQNFKTLPKEIGGFEMNEYLVLGVTLTYLQNNCDCELITRGGKRLSYMIKEAK